MSFVEGVMVAMRERDLVVVTVSVVVSSAIVLGFLARYGNIHTDEGWSFSEAVLVARGLRPYSDFFTHRLPLHPEVYGLWYRLAGESLLAGRILSVVLSTFAVAFLTYTIGRCVNSVLTILIGLAVLWNLQVIYALSTVATYALGFFLFSLSCLVLVLPISSPAVVAGAFLALQGAIWTLRYPVDIQVMIIVLFLFLSLYVLGWRWSLIAGFFLCASIGPAIALKSLWIGLDPRVLYDTVAFNFNQIPERISRGLIRDTEVGWWARVLLMRRLELADFYPVVVGGVVAYISLMRTALVSTSKWLLEKRVSLIIYCLAFSGAYYVFYVFTGLDSPITKVYIMPALAVAVALSADSALNSVHRRLRLVAAMTALLTLGLWPVAQVARENTVVHIRNNDIDSLNYVASELKTLLGEDALVLTFTPVLIQAGIELERGLTMETVSLLHNLSDREASYYHLITPALIEERIRTRAYGALVLDDRFLSSRHMSRILLPYRERWMEGVARGYELKKTLLEEGRYRGPFYVYLRTVEPSQGQGASTEERSTSQGTRMLTSNKKASVNWRR